MCEVFRQFYPQMKVKIVAYYTLWYLLLDFQQQIYTAVSEGKGQLSTNK
jgi:hypothetical protein